MKVLILSSNTGQGHNAVAQAIGQEFDRRGFVWECKDGLRFISGRTARFFSWGHSYMYRHLPFLFRRGYSWAEKHPGLLEEESPGRKYLGRGARELRLYLEQGQFDAIVCTHIFSALILTEALRQHPLSATTCFVATDYTCSPGVESCGLDFCYLPHPDLREEFRRHGIPDHKLIDGMIPLRADFFPSADKTAAKAALGIASDHRHLLLSSGSMGCGPIKDLTHLLVKKFDPNTELTIVCGTNEHLQKQLTEKYGTMENIHILGYTQNMSLLMDSADLYLTKPGGISTTEAAAKGLPMVFVDAVAGCERYNLRFFLDRGAAVTAKGPRKLAKLCHTLLEDPERLNSMAQAGRVIGAEAGAKRLCDTLQDHFHTYITA